MPTGLNRTYLVVLTLLCFGCSPVEDPTLFPVFDAAAVESPPAKPGVDRNPLRNLLWGDLHIHTSYSTDAYAMGVRSTPDDAYVFTRGGTIEHGAGYPIRIDRPLDFAAVTDHAEYLGAARADDSRVEALEERSLRDRLLYDSPLSLIPVVLSVARDITGEKRFADDPSVAAVVRDAWRATVESANAHYDPGVFTTFVGYEWTSMPDGQNLHRNVIYRDSNVPQTPFSSFESENPEDLWDLLDEQRAAGKRVIAIPHNGNVSNGLMYRQTRYDGSPITADYAEQRTRNEPVSEIFQIKGTSETHPMLSPEDEFADFEIMNSQLSPTGDDSEPKGSYARDALRTGIEFAHTEGFNPYRFGVIGSTDSHNASSSVEESNHHGKLPLMDGTAAIRMGEAIPLPDSLRRSRKWGAAGLAGVWAEENTRESIFDALVRRETFATSGPRILLRFFGSFNYSDELRQRADALQLAYARGVPMGGVLSKSDVPADGRHSAPGFFIWAAKDPAGANLDRVQIIKAWVDDDGRSHERIYNVALSDAGRLEEGGDAAPVGNTVDVTAASYSNSLGATQLNAFWRDPDFDGDSDAFYYARAIEIPTPRWSTYDARRLGIEAPQPTSIQERAVSSAIWYQAE
ncbi:DUF3604 domain-containing protein [Parahaliea aestuarii]|uniref:DUF3604 domain-containing protein n=1 Tax=Parahaliea aestuarii TaxID=1852021 RepID=A0A5C8ZT36_9GAMM|nr:DUF3604 domain-containing protein [Parahaliea aestuarii]TXS91616.1 DUF3604 domain-containing protein [Parahaliea aestuarii]